MSKMRRTLSNEEGEINDCSGASRFKDGLPDDPLPTCIGFRGGLSSCGHNCCCGSCGGDDFLGSGSGIASARRRCDVNTVTSSAAGLCPLGVSPEDSQDPASHPPQSLYAKRPLLGNSISPSIAVRGTRDWNISSGQPMDGIHLSQSSGSSVLASGNTCPQPMASLDRSHGLRPNFPTSVFATTSISLRFDQQIDATTDSLHRQTSWGAPLGGPSRIKQGASAGLPVQRYHEVNNEDDLYLGVSAPHREVSVENAIPPQNLAMPPTCNWGHGLPKLDINSTIASTSMKSLEAPSEAKKMIPLSVASAAAGAAVNAVKVASDAADSCIVARLCFEIISQTKVETLEKMDTELRSILFQTIEVGLSTRSLEQCLKRLDAIIAEMAAHISELRRTATVVFLKPGKIGPIIVDLCAPTTSPGIVATLPATPDFARLIEENHVLTAFAQRGPQEDKPLHYTTGLAFYQAPHESPFWLVNESHHSVLVPAMHAFVRRGARQLCNFWADQANDYNSADIQWRENLRVWEHRNDKSTYYKICRRKSTIGVLPSAKPASSGRGEGASRASLYSLDSSLSTVVSNVSATSRYAPTPIDGDETGGAGAPTRARKALRDETTEHERLMSEVLASSAKEARFERGAVDDQDLPVPLPISVLAREDPRLHESMLSCRVVSNPCVEDIRFSKCRMWSDLEKCIFLDKFLQYPKNFGKIAAFLTRKRARDCARLYYDSKHTIDYKALLREHQQRRRGVRICWDVTAKAVQVFGGELDYNPQRNLVWFRLPVDNFSITARYAYKEQNQHQRNTTDASARKSSGRVSGSRRGLPSKLSLSNSFLNAGDDIINNKKSTIRQPTQRKQGITKVPSSAIKGPITLGVTNKNHITVPHTKRNFSEKSEPGEEISAQKRLKTQKLHPISHPRCSHQNTSVSHNDLDSFGSINNMVGPQVYTPLTDAPPHLTDSFGHPCVKAANLFGGHDSSCGFLGHPLSTPSFSLGFQSQLVPSSALSRSTRSRGQQHHQSEKQTQTQKLAITQMRGDTTSLLASRSTYGLSSTTQLCDKQQRLAYNRLQQMAPVLPTFRLHDDSQHFCYQPSPSHFYSGTQDCSSTRHAADAAYIAILATNTDACGHMTGLSNASACNSQILTGVCMPDSPNRALASPRANYSESNKFFESQGLSPPPQTSKSKALHNSDAYTLSCVGYINTPSTDVATISHKELMVSATAIKTPTMITNAPTSRDKSTNSRIVDCRSVRNWTGAEKSLFLRHFVTLGKNWAALACFIPTKTEAQINSYYSNYKNRLGKEGILSFNRVRFDAQMQPSGCVINIPPTCSLQPDQVPAQNHFCTQVSNNVASFEQRQQKEIAASSATDNQGSYGPILQSNTGPAQQLNAGDTQDHHQQFYTQSGFTAQDWGGLKDLNDHQLTFSSFCASKQILQHSDQLSQILNEANHSMQLATVNFPIQPPPKLQPDWWPEYCS